MVLVLLIPKSQGLGQEAALSGDNPTTYSQFKEALLKDDLRRIDDYRQNSKANKAAKDQVSEYITTVYKKSLYSWGADWKKLVDAGDKLLKKDNNIMVWEAIAQAASQGATHASTKQIAFKTSLHKKELAARKIVRSRFIRERGYSEAWWIHNEIRILELNDNRRKTAARFGLTNHSLTVVSKTHVDNFIKRTVKWLSQQSDEGKNLRVAYNRIQRANELLFMPEYKQLYHLCAKTPKIAPWFLAMVNGEYEAKLAWDYRGNGFANEVSPENFKKFHQRQNIARGFFEKAWKMHPDFPEPAISMIRNAQSAGGNQSTRYWFDQAITAEIDNEMAYRAMLDSLLPKWGGSHKQMVDFALERVATQNFESDGPYHSLWAIKHIVDTLPTAAEKNEFIKRPEIYGALKEVLLGMAYVPSREESDACQRTREFCLEELLKYSIDADQSGDIAQVRRELGEAYDPSHFDGSTIIKISAATAKESNVGNDIIEAENLIASETDRVDPERLRESLDLLQNTRSECDSPDAELYFAHQAKKIRTELAFHRGEIVPLTFSRDLAGWIRDNNKWTVVDRRSIIGDCNDAGESATLSLFSASYFPTPFIFEAEVEVEVPKPKRRISITESEENIELPQFSPALIVGSLKPNQPSVTWTRPDGVKQTVHKAGRVIWFKPKDEKHGSDVGNVHMWVGDALGSTPKPLPSQKLNKNTTIITVVAYEQQFFYYINGRKGTPVKYGLDSSPLGVGSRLYKAKSGQAKFRNLTVRKLQSKSPWFDPQGGIDHYSELIENYPHLVECYFDRAAAWFANEQYDKSMLDLLKYRKLIGSPLEGRSFVLLGDVLMGQGRFNEAIRILEHQLDNPDKKVQNSAALKLVEILGGAPDKTIRNGKLALQYARVAARTEEFPFSNSKIAMAIAYTESGDLEKAKAYLKLALETEDVDLDYCQPRAQQIEQDGHYRIDTKPSQNEAITLKELVGKDLPDRNSQTDQVTGTGRTGQYQFEADAVSSSIVTNALRRSWTKPKKAYANQLKSKQEVDLPGVDKPTWQVYVPKDYSEDAVPAFGVIVFLGDESSTGVIPNEAYRKVLNEQRMIFISPNDTGKTAEPFVRDALAYQAVEIIRERYRIDQANIYVGGIGPNGDTASHTLYAMYKIPRVFSGALIRSKAALSKAMTRRNPYTLKDSWWQRSRFFFQTDEINGTLKAAQQKFIDEGYKNIKVQLAEDGENNLPSGNEFEQGILFLKSGAGIATGDDE